VRAVSGGNAVGFALEVPAALGAGAEPLRTACEAAVKGIAGVQSVTAVLTAHQDAHAGHDHKPAPAQRQAPPAPQGIPGVGQIIAVASGKGGVGKSTVAVNLALGLARLGLKVGLLDADIYGPSVPRLLDIKHKPESDGRKLKPIEKYGIKAMSIGFLIKEDEAMIWRGPMVQSALTQMMNDVLWAPLDVLVLDMPPGTGDAQLTIAQRVPLKGAVIVSTPQDIALIDAKKGIAMFRKTQVPILGIVENMSVFICPDCGHAHHIFGQHGARDTAENLGVPFLGEIPLLPASAKCRMPAPRSWWKARTGRKPRHSRRWREKSPPRSRPPTGPRRRSLSSERHEAIGETFGRDLVFAGDFCPGLAVEDKGRVAVKRFVNFG